MTRLVPVNRLASSKALLAGVGSVNAGGGAFSGAGSPSALSPLLVGVGSVGAAGTILFDGAPPSASSIVPPWSSNSGLSIFDNGEAWLDSLHIGRDLAQGSINDFFAYKDYGTPGQLGTQLREIWGQCAVSFDAFTGTWPVNNPQKMVIVAQYYDVQWGTFSNSRRKFQVIVSVVQDALSQRGQYFFQVLEWDDTTGVFRQGANVFQNSATLSPSSSFGRWDILRWHIVPDTSGSQVQANYGVGHGNGILQLWVNNQLVLNYANVNIVRGNPNVGVGRFHLSATSAGASWAGTNTRLYWSGFRLASAAAALPAMPSSPVDRVPSGPITGTGAPASLKPIIAGAGTTLGSGGGVHNPDNLDEGTTLLYSRDYNTQVNADIWNQESGIILAYSSTAGYASTGAWRAQPDPTNGSAENEPRGGWFGDQWGGTPSWLSATQHYVTVSFLMKATQDLIDLYDEGPGSFASHPLKWFDFKYKISGGGEGGRNGFHFSKDIGGAGGGGVRFYTSAGGGGASNNSFDACRDFRTLGDTWLWICFVIDMRGATAAERFLAMYMKVEGEADVVRQIRRFENQVVDGLTLSAYNGFGLWGLFSPFCGYWDDMNGRDSFTSAQLTKLANAFMTLDRVRVYNGYPPAADGAPF